MKEKLKILYLRDPGASKSQEKLLLKKSFEVRTITDRNEFLNALGSFVPHILLYSFPSSIITPEILETMQNSYGRLPLIIACPGGDLTNVLPLLKSGLLNLKEQKVKKAKKEHKDLKERYRTVYENSLDGILLTQPDGSILAANPAACRMFQMTEEEICLAGRSGLVDKDDPRLQIGIKQREKVGKAFTELNLIKKNGKKFPVELTSSIFKGLRGELKTMIIFRDISERKKAEALLHHSNETYKATFYHSPVPYWIYDRDTFQIIDVNEAALQNYGYSREEFLALDIFDLRLQDKIPHLDEHLGKMKPLKEIIHQGDFTHVRKNRSKLKVKVSGYNLQYQGRNCRMVACVDITDREDFLEQLKEKQARLKAAQEIAKIGYWQLDIQNETVIIDDMMNKVWQFPPSIQSPNWETIKAAIHPEDLKNFLRVQKCSMEKGLDHSLEYRISTSTGPKWIQEKGRVLKWEKGKPRLVERTVQDITEQKNYVKRLSISEARYKGIVNSQTNYLIRTDMEGNYTYYNQKFLSEFGWLYGANDIIGKPSLSSIMEYHHQAVIDVVGKCVSKPGSPFQIEIDKPLKEGGVKTTIWDFVCLQNIHGEPSEIQCVGIDITERVKAEEELKDSRLRYLLITEAVSDAVWDWDLYTGNLVWGNTLKSLFGYEPDDFDTMNKWEKIISSEDAPRVIKELNKLLKGKGKDWQIEYLLRKFDGTQAYVLEKGTILRDEDGRAYRMVCAIRDVTEKKKLQDLLKKANSLSRIGSFEWNIFTNKIYWSKMTREIHEVNEDFIPTFDNAISFYKEGSRELIKNALSKAIGNNEPFDEELEIVTLRGNTLWVRVIGQPGVENGECVRISGSFQDIDKIKRAEQNVIHAAKEKEILLESLGDGFFAVDRNWQVTYWNKHAANLLKCAKEEILGKNIWEIFPDALETAFHKNYEATMQDRRKRHFEAFFERTSSWFEVNVYPSTEGLSIFFKDVTQKKIAKVKLKGLNKSLKAYTRELVTANKGLEQFSHIVSHNLRAPVANILGLGDLLKNVDFPSRVKKQFLEEIFSNIDRLDAIITDLNSILQTKGNIRTKKEDVRLDELVQGITSSIQHLVNEEEAKIIFDFKQVPNINTVRSYLHSIFYNLILNSIKYRRPDVAPVINIKAFSKGDFNMLVFKDNGLGIDLSVQGDQIFNLYKRFHYDIEGKGMGLFMVKTQVEMLGGKITIKSEVNKGTTFTIIFKNNNKPIEVENEPRLSLPNY